MAFHELAAYDFQHWAAGQKMAVNSPRSPTCRGNISNETSPANELGRNEGIVAIP